MIVFLIGTEEEGGMDEMGVGRELIDELGEGVFLTILTFLKGFSGSSLIGGLVDFEILMGLWIGSSEGEGLIISSSS
jgi:hypothetical protein